MANFFEELKRRNVIKSALAYLVVAWVLLQVFTTLLPIVGGPDWILEGLTALLAIGLPIWIIVSWIYNITPKGIEKTPKNSENEIVKNLTNKRLNAFLIVSLSLAVIVMGLKISNVFSPASDEQYAIAVMPFLNMSDDPEQEYFSDGISEEIINMLAQVPKLKVMGRTSSFAFKGKNMDLKLIGEQLKVSYILEGSVRRSGNILRITAQLINVADGTHLYSDKFDRELEDIFAIQDEISEEILHAIKIKLFGSEIDAVFKKYTDNLEAYQLYLKGKFYYNKYTREGFLKAIDYFNQAIVLDSDYAIAYAGIAFCYQTLTHFSWLPANQGLLLAKKAAQQSIQLDDQIAESHITMGRINLHTDWNIREAFIEQKKAVAINPNNPEVYVQLGMCAILLGHYEEAMEYSNRAISLDPFSTMNVWMAAIVPIAARDADKSLEISKQLIELNPDFFGGHLFAGLAYRYMGKYEEALQEHKTAVRLQNIPYTLGSLGFLYGIFGKKTKAREVIEEMKQLKDIEFSGNNFIADVYLVLGEWDTAFKYYNRAIENREGHMIWKKDLFKNIPNLMEDPRAIEMFERMNIVY